MIFFSLIVGINSLFLDKNKFLKYLAGMVKQNKKYNPDRIQERLKRDLSKFLYAFSMKRPILHNINIIKVITISLYIMYANIKVVNVASLSEIFIYP